jgi:hypothetical protein
MSARSMFVAAILFAAGLRAEPLFAADQTEYLKKAPLVLPPTVGIANPSATYDQIRGLMAVAFPNAGADIDSPDFYCVVHVLEWGDSLNSVSGSKWYVYRGRGGQATPGGPWSIERFRGTRILGSDRLRVAYVHLNVPAEPTNTQVGVNALAAIKDKGSALSSRNSPLVQIGSHLVERDHVGVTYQIDVVKKLPAPIQNLSDALGLLQSAAAGVQLSSHVALYAADTFDIAHVPSDITIGGKAKWGPPAAPTITDLGKQTFDNEGLYAWDISLGIPLRSVKELDFEASGGQVFAKEVERTQLMLFLNLFIKPVDTKNVRFLAFPRPVVGVALSKKPLERLFVGASMGLNKVQVFAGAQWSQIKDAPEPGSDATPQPTSRMKYSDPTFMMGINVPVRQVADFLKAKK